MDLVIRGCGSLGAHVAMRAERAGLAVTLMAEDLSEAERLSDSLRAFPGISVRTEQDGLPATACALAPPGLLPDVPLCLALAGPGNPLPRHAAAIFFHDTLAEVGFAHVGEAGRAAMLALLDRLGLAVAEAPPGATRFAGLALLDHAAALADRIVLLGATPWEVDEAMEAFGFTRGVFAAQDIAGLDLAYARRRAADNAHLLVTDRMVQEGRLGRGAGVGWYRYPGGGGAVIDPLMEDMATEEARFAGIRQRMVPQAEIVQRIVLGLACKGAQLLVAGDAQGARQIDALCRKVLFYPVNGDGVLAHARRMDRDVLAERLVRFGTDDAELWSATALLRMLG